MTTRERRDIPETLDELVARVWPFVALLRRCGMDEIAQDLEDEIQGDPPDADCDAYGNVLTEPPDPEL